MAEVLENRLGFKDKDQLNTVMATLVALRQQELRHLRQNTDHFRFKEDFNIDYFQKIHQHLYKDVYDWAGELRTSNMLPNDLSQSDFSIHPDHGIRTSSNGVFDRLNTTDFSYYNEFDQEVSDSYKASNKRYISKQDFCELSARFMTDMYRISPFQDGNRQAICALTDEFAHRYNYEVAWEDIKPEELENAFRECHSLNYNQYYDQYEKERFDVSPNPSGFVTLLERNVYEKDIKRLLNLVKSATPGLNRVNCEQAQQMGNYRGPLLGVTEKYVVQYQIDKPEEIILHDRYKLTPAPSFDESDRSQILNIEYPHGDVGLVRRVNELNKVNNPSFEKSLFFKQTDHER